MKVKITKRIGKANLEVDIEGANETETLVRTSGITTMPDKCGLCKNEDVMLTSNKAQEKYTYIKIRCLNVECGATSTMGEYQDKSGVYWKAFSIYNKGDKSEK